MGPKKNNQAKPEGETPDAKKKSKLKVTPAKSSVKSASRKRADDAELFKAVVQHTHDGIIFINREREITYASPSITQISGYEPDELTGKNGVDFIHLDDQEAATENVINLLQNPGKTNSIEYRIKHKNGSWVWVDSSATNLLNNPHVQAVVLNMRDITERKLAEEKLREKDTQIRSLSDNLPNGYVYQVDFGLHGEMRQFNYISAGVERLHGITMQQVLDAPLTLYEQMLEEDRVRVTEMEASAFASMTIFKAEARYRIGTDQIGWMLLTSTPRKLDNNHIVWDGIVLDITERKQAEEALRNSEELHRITLSSISDAVFITDNDGKFSYICPNVEVIFGYSQAEVSAIENIGSLLDNAFLVSRDIDTSQEIQNIEQPIITKYGIHRDLLVNIKRVSIRNGTILYTCRDITERKQAEQALRESEALYRLAIEVAGAVPYRQSYTSGEFHINYEFIGEGIRQLTGYGPEEVSEALWDALVRESHPLGELAQYSFKEAAHRVRTGASPVWQCEHRFQARNGEMRWIFEASVELRDEHGVSHGSIGMYQDITERKQAEQALRESEALYRKAIEVAGAVPYYESYYDHNKKIKYEFIGEGIRQITGYGPEEFTAELWDSLVLDIHPVEDLEGYSLDDAIERVRGGLNSIWTCEHRIRHRNGEVHWVFEAAVELRDEHGGPRGSIGMYQDITARKLAEAALRENEKRLSLFFNQSLDGFFFSMLAEPIEWDTTSDKEKLLDYVLTHQHITEANDAMLEQYGATRAKFIGRTASDFFAHDLEQARRFRKDLFDHGHMHIDTEERKDDGTPIWIEGDYVCMRDAQNRVIGMFGIQRDATLRKKAEEELRESENRFRNLVERLTQVIYTSEIGVNGIWSYVSPQIENLLGFTTQAWASNPNFWSQQVHPDDRDKQIALEEQAYERGEPFEGEYRIKTRAGKWIWVRDSGQVLPPQGNGPAIVQGILMDITEHKQAEDALNLSKAQLLANLENTPNVAVQWYDEQGRILYLNPASETLYNVKSEEALGKTLDQLIHTPEEQAEFMRILAEIRATGKTYGPYEAQVHTPGMGTSWVLATTFSLPMNEGRIGFVCMDVDITGLKQAEEQIQKQLRRLNALHTVDMAINSSANLQITLEVLLNQALSQLNADAADVLLFNQTAQSLELTAERGFRSTAALPKYQRLGDFFAGQVINQRRTLHIPDMPRAGQQLKRTPMFVSEAFTDYIGVPLIAKGQIKGVLEIYQRSPLHINDDWLNFLEVLAGQAAIAIDNSQLVYGLQRSTMEIIVAYDATIEGWSRAMDLRDKETEGHTQRVTTMTVKLARAMGIRETDILHIQRGGLLHDMGKLGVPDNILFKAGALTDEEWEVMRQHPTFALNMLAPISYLKNAIAIPYCHHEKWNGTGYPRGLKGEQIPLAARIFAVADVWDALTSDRPYRTAWSHEKVLEYIMEQSGRQFDPQVVEAFLKLITTES
ncbi:MAG: PAS domain S-box protein [Chloroflexota bacterium]